MAALFVLVFIALFALLMFAMRGKDPVIENEPAAIIDCARKSISDFSNQSFPDCTEIIIDQLRRMDPSNSAYRPFRKDIKLKTYAMILDACVFLLESGEYTIGGGLITGFGAQIVEIAKTANHALLLEKGITVQQYDFLNEQIRNAQRPQMFRQLFGD